LTRRELLWQVGLWLGPESDPDRVGGRNDHPQVEMELEDPFADLPFPDLDATDRMVAEYRTLRFATSAHPFSLFADRLPPGTVTSEELAELPDGATVTVAGIVTARQRPQTAKGYTFVLLDDEYGSINSIVKPRLYEKHRATVRMEPFIVVRGRLQKDGDTINVIAFRVWPLRLEEDAGGRSGSGEGPMDTPPAHEWWGPEKEGGTTSRWGSRTTSPSEGDGEAGAKSPSGIRGEDRAGATRKAGSDPFRFLTALRQTPPGVKNWG
ncbi:MAG: OB-fold nucleic acid binding domain-containing protein, partial [Longimicrobiales bacterium]|nr:OB-fold nucleic acid binding domain-containing protein [Longimicrobiales bacterium]